MTIGPSVCPTSIIVARNPIEAPTKEGGTKSAIKGEVEESTAANATPYPTFNKIKRGNCVENGIAATKRQLATDPARIGLLRPMRSETLPIKGRAMTSAAI